MTRHRQTPSRLARGPSCQGTLSTLVPVVGPPPPRRRRRHWQRHGSPAAEMLVIQGCWYVIYFFWCLSPSRSLDGVVIPLTGKGVHSRPHCVRALYWRLRIAVYFSWRSRGFGFDGVLRVVHEANLIQKSCFVEFFYLLVRP